MYYVYAYFDGAGVVPVTITKKERSDIYAISNDSIKYLLEEEDLFETEEANIWIAKNKPTLPLVGDWM